MIDSFPKDLELIAVKLMRIFDYLIDFEHTSDDTNKNPKSLKEISLQTGEMKPV